MIDVIREGSYAGSEIVIEQELDPGFNYDRAVASYQSEGLKIYALLTVPRGQAPESGWPVVIFNHGYIPPEQYRTTERYVAYVDAFARNGYVVFRSDYRGHGSSEGEARGSYSTPDYTVDVLNAVSAIKQYPGVDPERIGMWGHSMGGSITLRAMVVSDDVKAGVIWAGVVAPYTALIERWRRLRGEQYVAQGLPTPTPNPRWTRRRWREDLVETYGSPEDNPAFWASISPSSYLADLSGPIQLHHGTADKSVPVEFSEELYVQLTELDPMTEYAQASELYTYKGDDHNIVNSFGQAMQRSVAFFDRYLKEG
jgi:dipeptidyl aminopeptidase/acylaminoacyl peptidase